jgi:alpha-galactosidase
MGARRCTSRSCGTSRLFPAICLRGLDPGSVYQIRTIDDKLADRWQIPNGAALMNRGLTLRLGGDFDSTMLIFNRVDH